MWILLEEKARIPPRLLAELLHLLVASLLGADECIRPYTNNT